MPYVFTNPPKDTELFSCDKVFILSQTPVKINKVLKDDSKEMQMYHDIRYRRKTIDDVVSSVSNLHNDLKNMEEQRKQINSMKSQLDHLTTDVNSKFDILFKALNIGPAKDFVNNNNNQSNQEQKSRPSQLHFDGQKIVPVPAPVPSPPTGPSRPGTPNINQLRKQISFH